MKIVVDEFPIYPSECIFGDYDSYYGVAECKLSPNCAMECHDVEKCPYLVAISDSKDPNDSCYNWRMKEYER